MTAELASEFGIPSSVMDFVASGFLQVVSSDAATRTIEFHIPSMRFVDRQDRITTCAVTWIHPAFNEQFCRYYRERPGDLPNFCVTEDMSEVGDEDLDGLETVTDLVEWLTQCQNSQRN